VIVGFSQHPSQLEFLKLGAADRPLSSGRMADVGKSGHRHAGQQMAGTGRKKPVSLRRRDRLKPPE
jgi:hypothetical protein